MPARITIPFIDFGGSGPPLHFAHANGYPPGAYLPLLELLAAKTHVFAMHMRPLWPGASPNGPHDWIHLSDDLSRFLDERGFPKWIGAGHSMGATATLRLALRRPNLFQALVLVDPILLLPWMMHLWNLVYHLGLGQRLYPMVKSAQRRRKVFESPESMYENYRSKSVFKNIDDHGLQIYVQAMARPDNDGQVTLAYPPKWETHFYLTGGRCDLDLWRDLSGLKPPILIIRGGDSDIFWESTALRVQRLLPQSRVFSIPGATHLVPLESPDLVFEVAQKFIKEVGDKG
jgi:pimeloyl-ACP methyl ester carboxylesterase